VTDPDLRDPNLDRAYRDTPRDEPPAELDERIRAAARRAVVTGPQSLEQRAVEDQRRSWTSRWRLPLSVAATVVIAATLTVMVQEEDSRPRDDAGRSIEQMKAPAREAEQPASPAASSSDAAGDMLNQLPAAAPAQSSSSAPAPAAPPAQGRTARKSTAEPTAREHSDAELRLRREERAFPAQPPAGVESAPVAPAELEMRRQSTAPAAAPPLAAPAPALPSPPAAAPAPAPAPRPAAKAVQETAPAGAASGTLQRDRSLGDRPERASREASAIRSPEAWVEYIRSLRAQGRETEATAELAGLRRAYPDFKLPSDLGGPSTGR
jgi:hypothetical protein